MPIRLVVPVLSAETLEKARPGLVYRTDLPYHKPDGSVGYRRGWVRPDDVKILNQAKKKGDAASAIGKYKYEADLFDDADGDAWEQKSPKKKQPKSPEKKGNEITLSGQTFPYIILRGGKEIGTLSRRVTSSRKDGVKSTEYVVRDRDYTILAVGSTQEEALDVFGVQPKPDAMANQDSLLGDDSDGLVKQETPITERIPTPEPVQPTPEGKEKKGKPEAPVKEPVSVDVQADLEKPIVKMKFRDYGSWSASGKHLSAKKRAEINQKIAEIINLPADEIDGKELELVRQYSGFGGVAAEDERGVLYDYYTSPPAARMVWKLLNKIAPMKSGAKVLEPSCGTGVFFDVAPQGLNLTGVEYDNRTATVAGLLQGDKSRIYQSSFEQFNLHNKEKFDSVVGNAPFGDRSVQTSFLDEPVEKSLDRYFISRSLDSLKGGGSMALIVAPGVMDNVSNKEWRAKMLRKGQFIGAVRLPNQSFKHTGTGVSPDVVMFRAYPADIRSKLASMTDEDMKTAGFWDDSWVGGSYYDELPGHRLGRVERGNFDSEVTVGKLDPEDMDYAFDSFQARPPKTVEDFAKVREYALSNNQTPFFAVEGAENNVEQLTESEAAAVAAKTLRVGMTKTEGGKVYRLNENHRWELVQASDGVANRLDRIKEISETVKRIREAMQTDSPVDDLQRQARALIQAYEKDFGVSHADDKQVDRFIKNNPALSGVYEALTTRLDSDILNKNSIYEKSINLMDGHSPAIAALYTLQQNMKDATPETLEAYFPGKSKALIEAMWDDPDVFVDERGVFQLREDFISGNAWEKIDALEAAMKWFTGPEYERNREQWQYGIDSLRDAIGWVSIEEAEITPQSSWIPESIINDWLTKEGHKPPNGYRYGRSETGKWGLIANEYKAGQYNWRKRSSESDIEEGDWKEHNDEVIYFLNNQKQRSKYTETDIYNENMISSFKVWLAGDEEARRQAENVYNRSFNTELGSPTKVYPVHLDGWSEARKINPWQWQSVHHLYRQGKGISALGTGFGKTESAIALLALLRQEGKVKRPFFQVPNNKVKDWVRHFNEDMPGLKIGSVDPENKGYGDQATRYKWYQELAFGDYDVIILPETSASEIQLNPKNDQAIVDSIAHQFTAPKEDGTKTLRKKEQEIQSAEAKLTGGKKNKTISFEDFGCDAVFCDEAHRLKNLFTSSLSRETGLNDGRRSDRALSFFKKCEHIRRNHDNKNVFLLTATPLTNSPLEYYNMMQHVAPEELKKLNIANIDDFIRNFANIEEGDGYDPFSGKLRKTKILTGFKNLRTLQDMFFKYTDLQNDPSKIGMKKPSANNKPNILPKQDDQVVVIQSIAQEVEEFKKMSKEEREGLHLNNFVFYNRMRTASLDLELYDPQKYKGWKNPKIEKMAESAAEIYKNRGGGQVVFCDRVLSGDGSMNMHDKIKKSLVARGFKESEIVIVNGITKSGGKVSESAMEAQVSEAIKGFNGEYDKKNKKWITPPKYKVIIGTTQTIGEGVNLQTNSSALHHMDIPFRPSDFIQRNGRIDRQGNQQLSVELHTYATKGTIDNYSMALVSGKENWINQLLKTKSNVFTNPDAEGASNMDEILMSLTEEWGDKAGAEEKRAALEAKKTEAIRVENAKKARDFVRQLALMRGALASYEGDKSSRDYQTRLRKIDNLDESLSRNPEFKNPEVLGKDAVPFIYHEGRDSIVKKGDLIISSGQLLIADEFNYKRRSIGTRLQANNERGDWIDAYDPDSGASSNIFISNPTPKDVEHYRILLDDDAFYSQPMSFKKENYREFLKINYKSVKLYKAYNGGYTTSEWRAESKKPVNVFDENVRKDVAESLKNGLMDAKEYAIAEKRFGVFGDQNESKNALLKKFNEHPKAQTVSDYIKKRQAQVADGWVALDSISSALLMPEWDLRGLVDLHPDIEVQEKQGYVQVHGRRGSTRRQWGTKRYIRFKDGVEKSLEVSRIIAEGGREHVLYQRRG